MVRPERFELPASWFVAGYSERRESIENRTFPHISTVLFTMRILPDTYLNSLVAGVCYSTLRTGAR
jgi:hypothetical protein